MVDDCCWLIETNTPRQVGKVPYSIIPTGFACAQGPLGRVASPLTPLLSPGNDKRTTDPSD